MQYDVHSDADLGRVDCPWTETPRSGTLDIKRGMVVAGTG